MPGRQSSKSSNNAPKYHSPIGPIMSSSQLPSYSPPTQTHNQYPGFFQTMKDGVALGAGSAIGSRIVSGIFGPPTIQTSPANPGSNPGTPTVYGSSAGKPCEVIQTSFDSCIQQRKPVEECEQTLSLLNKCLSGSS
jgi:hypothetical protein